MHLVKGDLRSAFFLGAGRDTYCNGSKKHGQRCSSNKHPGRTVFRLSDEIE